MNNFDIAKVLNQIADILEIKNANRFRIIAHQRAAESIKTMPVNIKTIYEKGNLQDIPGVGVETFKIKVLHYLAQDFWKSTDSDKIFCNFAKLFPT